MKLWPSKKEKIFPKEGIDYVFMDRDGAEQVSAIRIITGRFEGVIYHYGKVEVAEESKPTVKFEYFIDDEGTFEIKELQNNKKFDTLMGDILVSIFDTNILKKEKEIDEPLGIINPEKLDLQ